MNLSQPRSALRLSWERGAQVVTQCRMAAFVVLGLCSLVVASDDTGPTELLPAEPAEAQTVGRAQLIADDSEDVDPAVTALLEEILPTSAQTPPVLVPLPDPILPAPSVPAPPDAGVSEELAPELLPPSPEIPWLDPTCPDCVAGSSLVTTPEYDFLPGNYALNPVEDKFGIGSRQVPFAIFHIDPVQPLSQVRMRTDFAYGLKTPDRAERFWSAPPLGPATPERKIDYQTYSVYGETGGQYFSGFAEIPLLSINPEVNGNTGGLGNVMVGQKFLLTNPKNRRWQIAEIFKSYHPTGAESRGLGNGLTALEPGLLFRYRHSDLTYFHGEVKYWIPLGGVPNYTGRIAQYGIGASTVLWQSDEKALMSTLEFVGYTIGDGLATLPDGTVRQANGDTFVSILPGVRMALGPSGDLGLFEIGVTGGVTVGDPGWYSSRALLDLRWSY